METTKQWLERITKEFAQENFGIYINVKFRNSIRKWGTCYPSKNLVTYSNQFIEANEDNYEVLEALLKHECCHLKESNHGKKFKELLKKFGVNNNHTDRLGIEINRPQPSKYYVYECTNCGRESRKMVLFKREHACGVCCDSYNGGKYDSKFNMKFVRKVEKGRWRND